MFHHPNLWYLMWLYAHHGHHFMLHARHFGHRAGQDGHRWMQGGRDWMRGFKPGTGSTGTVTPGR
jgi:hypothetical protein